MARACSCASDQDPIFNVVGSVHKNKEVCSPQTGRCYALIDVGFAIERRFISFLIRMLLPELLLAIMACASFWIDPKVAPARTGLLTAVTLTFFTLQFRNSKHVPVVSYITWLDLYENFLFSAICVCVFVYFYVHFSSRSDSGVSKDEQAKAINCDKTCRYFLPIFVLVGATSAIVLGVVLGRSVQDSWDLAPTKWH